MEPTTNFWNGVEQVFDSLLAKLRCRDESEVCLLAHWQGNLYCIQITRKSDHRSLIRYVDGTEVPTADEWRKFSHDKI